MLATRFLSRDRIVSHEVIEVSLSIQHGEDPAGRDAGGFRLAAGWFLIAQKVARATVCRAVFGPGKAENEGKHPDAVS